MLKLTNVPAAQNEPDKVRLTLPDISQRLKAALSQLPECDLVVGIATGGTVLASLAAHELALPLKLIRINYRAEDNAPQRAKPTLLQPFELTGQPRILLVDDISVTGATFRVATTLLEAYEVTTLALKGRANSVLYPEVTRCVLLPWRD